MATLLPASAELPEDGRLPTAILSVEQIGGVIAELKIAGFKGRFLDVLEKSQADGVAPTQTELEEALDVDGVLTVTTPLLDGTTLAAIRNDLGVNPEEMDAYVNLPAGTYAVWENCQVGEALMATTKE